jgi:hypothetical protein
MPLEILNPEDLRQIAEMGMAPEQVLQQIALFQRPPCYPKLLRPCTLGDGIIALSPDKAEDLISFFEENAKGRCLKFVPASGAATRMFKALLSFFFKEENVSRDLLEKISGQGDEEAQHLLTFMDRIQEFAFYDDLISALSSAGLRMNPLLQEGQLKKILAFLLFEPGLRYLDLPKGLIRFHRYATEKRTPFEEHLIEAASYMADEDGKCRLHFTVSPAHLDLFLGLLELVRPSFEKRFKVSFDVTFSFQRPSTETVAVDFENRPIHLEDGRLLFRPGGHGALIENLNDLQGDILFIKNIDNVVPDRLRPEMIRWKKILGGYLIRLQGRIFEFLDRLSSAGCAEQIASEAARFLKEALFIGLPSFFSSSSLEEKQRLLMERLNRPLRVCGMVRNVGEPGGGPFWVGHPGGGSSLQIVESAQVDPASREQQGIFSQSTHFNPVDIVCGVRDRWGKPFDLCSFVDSDTCIVTKKSKDGEELKALELPGLWNGGMAGWITVFLEVPLETFNPVKTVNDLLRESHLQEQ